MRIYQKILIFFGCVLMAFCFYMAKKEPLYVDLPQISEESIISEESETCSLEPVLEDSAPEPVLEDSAPEPVLEDSAPEPVLEISEEELNRETAGFEEAPISIEVDEDFFYYTEFSYSGKVYKPGRLTEEEQRYIYQTCLKYDIEYELVLGLMGVETRWKLNTGDGNGHIGVGQISKKYHYERFLDMGLDLYEPYDNIECVCIILSSKLKTYGDYHKALTVYNCGDAGAYSRYFNKGIFQSSYSIKVIGFRNAMIKTQIITRKDTKSELSGENEEK